ncbi:enoyl-CoA hydratase/isomerase family protein [Acidovorax sp. Be4]|uniref:Enoyl-CoA hydratase/isomerase family protein n=1 Tax=Acidovorax bellezanensis TaxID=2976702 RepID=A0ABT2PRH4_9BURK|nr:enoyl-CoA hydratase/isomerase family protein [Acidovorax sp. Be4]MCT9812823.1 enoyl-CoA hydratase/isomerase family protein [Acidovorax sp. Be4]
MAQALVTVLDEKHVGSEGDAVRVRRITLNRADKANAMTADMMRSVARIVAEQAADVHVLQSASARLFCAGADIAEFLAGEQALAEQEHALLALIESLSQSQVPLLAVVRGKASGAGVLLLALSDVVLAAEGSQLACPEIQFGMYPVIVDAVLNARISPALASRMCLGQALGALDAWQVGLVTEVIPQADFDAVVAQRLDYFLARSGSLAIARQCRQRMASAQAVVQRVQSVAPLMGDNYRGGGVRERISGYLSDLARKRNPAGA